MFKGLILKLHLWPCLKMFYACLLLNGIKLVNLLDFKESSSKGSVSTGLELGDVEPIFLISKSF